jgi:hypothetical protein
MTQADPAFRRRVPVRAGFTMGVLLFGVGFALGTIRVLLVAPVTGTFWATALEVPVMLAAAWVLAGRLCWWLDVPPALSARLAMGVTGFAVLMGLEWLMAMAGMNQTPAQIWQGMMTAPGLLGLVAQTVSFLFPALRR